MTECDMHVCVSGYVYVCTYPACVRVGGCACLHLHIILLTFSRVMSSRADTRNGTTLLMNQLTHSVPVPMPMILMVSLRRASFSYTTPLMIMATE